MDIGSGKGYPSSALSNFAPHAFVIDGVECASMEGFLQSLKFDKEHIQIEVCKLIGREAKFRGKKRNKAWQKVQTLWWKGIPYQRQSEGYFELICRAYWCMYTQNTKFRKAIQDSINAVYTHSIGHNDVSKTVLTEREFCNILHRLQKIEQSQNTGKI